MPSAPASIIATCSTSEGSREADDGEDVVELRVERHLAQRCPALAWVLGMQ
jgi:hypothetical protein